MHRSQVYAEGGVSACIHAHPVHPCKFPTHYPSRRAHYRVFLVRSGEGAIPGVPPLSSGQSLN